MTQSEPSQRVPQYFTVMGRRNIHGDFVPAAVIAGNYDSIVVAATSAGHALEEAVRVYAWLHPRLEDQPPGVHDGE